MMILSRCILVFPLSLGMRMTIDVNHCLSSLALSSAIEVILWWSFHILSLKSSFSFEYWTPLGVNREWWCLRWRHEGDVVVFSFQLRKTFLYSSNRMVFCFEEWITSLFLVILSKYRLVTLVSGTWRKFASPFNSDSVQGVSLSVPKRDRNGSTRKGESCAWLKWCELRSATSFSISIGLSIILKTISFFPFMLF